MFDVFKSLAKAAVSVVDIPVSAVADVVTLGGALNDRDKPYTASAASRLVRNLKDAAS